MQKALYLSFSFLDNPVDKFCYSSIYIGNRECIVGHTWDLLLFNTMHTHIHTHIQRERKKEGMFYTISVYRYLFVYVINR